jgi:hypothetical protein
MPQDDCAQVAFADKSLEKNTPARDPARAIEFMCWTALAIMPVLYLTNGPAVTGDQGVVRVLFAVSVLTGAVALRFYRRRRDRAKLSP